MANKDIKYWSDQYFKSQASGDAEGMQYANDQANMIRNQQGQDAQHATNAISHVRNQNKPTQPKPITVQPSTPQLTDGGSVLDAIDRKTNRDTGTRVQHSGNDYGSYIDTSRDTFALDTIDRRTMRDDERSYSMIDGNIVPFSTKEDARNRALENMMRLPEHWNDSEVGSYWEGSLIQRYGFSREEINQLKSQAGIDTSKAPPVFNISGPDTADYLGTDPNSGRRGAPAEDWVDTIYNRGEDDPYYEKGVDMAKRYGLQGYDSNDYIIPNTYNQIQNLAYGDSDARMTPERAQREIDRGIGILDEWNETGVRPDTTRSQSVANSSLAQSEMNMGRDPYRTPESGKPVGDDYVPGGIPRDYIEYVTNNIINFTGSQEPVVIENYYPLNGTDNTSGGIYETDQGKFVQSSRGEIKEVTDAMWKQYQQEIMNR